MKKPKEKSELHIRPRPTETVTIKIPEDTLESLKKVAVKRDMSYQALLKFYIGQGLRQDLAGYLETRCWKRPPKFYQPVGERLRKFPITPLSAQLPTVCSRFRGKIIF